MKWSAVNTAARRSADDDRDRRIPKIMRFGHKVGYLVEAARDEIYELHFANGTQAQKTHAASRADDCRLGNGRLDHAFTAEFRQHSVGDFKCSAINPYVLADRHNGSIAFHFLENRLANGFHPRNSGGFW